MLRRQISMDQALPYCQDLGLNAHYPAPVQHWNLSVLLPSFMTLEFNCSTSTAGRHRSEVGEYSPLEGMPSGSGTDRQPRQWRKMPHWPLPKIHTGASSQTQKTLELKLWWMRMSGSWPSKETARQHRRRQNKTVNGWAWRCSTY